ncbi:hypothetical protein VZT92_012609 [Zoarces viviparus]|uniref:Uncharacterized protein n=1 Tax=Zoarces viviparus TaxID=48416 RepID=A0AAW1F2K4_ZOAVI
MKVSHLKASQTDYGSQLQSTNFSTIEEVNSDDVVGALGVDAEGEPGSLNLMLDDGRTVIITEALWTPIEPLLINPPLKIRTQLTGNHITKVTVE